MNGRFWNNTTNAPPWGFNVIVNSPVGGFRDPFLGVAGGNPFPIAEFGPDAKFTPYGPFLGLPPNQKMTRVHQWNLSAQRQIGANWLVSASYLGSETEHLWQSVQLNPGAFLGLGACTLQGVTYNPCSQNNKLNQRRVFSLAGLPGAEYLGFVDQYTDGGTASYQGPAPFRPTPRPRRFHSHRKLHLVPLHRRFHARRRNSRHRYRLLDPDNRRFDRGNCSNDRRHIANVTWVAETPRFADPLAARDRDRMEVVWNLQSVVGASVDVDHEPGPAVERHQRPTADAGAGGPILRNQDDHLLAQSGGVSATGFGFPRQHRPLQRFWPGVLGDRRLPFQSVPGSGTPHHRNPGGGVQPHQQHARERADGEHQYQHLRTDPVGARPEDHAVRNEICFLTEK